MKAPVIVYSRGVCACPVCGVLGTVGASCDECLRRAYRAVLAVARRGLLTAAQQYGAYCDLARLMRREQEALLAGLSGAELCREVLPGARFELPEVGR